MALVHDDEVEEIRGEFLVKSGTALVLGDGLIRGEIKLAAVDHHPALDFVPRIAEPGKGFVLGIIHQEITVCEVQDARLPGRIALGVPLGRPEFPADLKRHDSLAGASGHCQQHALLALQNRPHHAVNRDALVVIWNLAAGKIEGRQQPFHGVLGQLFRRHQPRPQFRRSGKGGNGPLDAGEGVEFDDLFAVGGVAKFQVQNFPIFLRLLHAVGGFFVFRLGLGHGKGEIAGVVEQIIGALFLFALALAAAHDDPAIGEAALLGDGVRVGIPARSLELRHDKLPACIRFGRHCSL